MKRPERNAFDPIEMRLGAKVERKVEKAKRPDRVIAPGVVECGETGKMRTEFPRRGCWEPKPVEKRLPKVGDRIRLTAPKRVEPNRTLGKGYMAMIEWVDYCQIRHASKSISGTAHIRDRLGFFYPLSVEGSDWEFAK